MPDAAAGRRDRPGPLPGAGPPVRSGGGRFWHLPLPRPRRGSLPGPGRSGAGAAAALACAAARRHRQLPDRRRARYGRGQLAVPDPVALAGASVPALWPDAAAYDATVRRLIGGAALDERSVYFLARLSPRYPTVEIRVADVCLGVDTAAPLAGLARALVATALAEARRGTPVAAAPARRVAAALVAAARQGLSGTGVDPFTAQKPAPTRIDGPGRSPRMRGTAASRPTGQAHSVIESPGSVRGSPAARIDLTALSGGFPYAGIRRLGAQPRPGMTLGDAAGGPTDMPVHMASALGVIAALALRLRPGVPVSNPAAVCGLGRSLGGRPLRQRVLTASPLARAVALRGGMPRTQAPPAEPGRSWRGACP